MLTPQEAYSLVKETLRLSLANGAISEAGYNQALRELSGVIEEEAQQQWRQQPMPAPEFEHMKIPHYDANGYSGWGVSGLQMPATVSTGAHIPTIVTTASWFQAPPMLVFSTAEEFKTHQERTQPKRRKGKKR